MFENVVGSFELTEIIKAIHFQSTILKRFMNLTKISLNHNKVMKGSKIQSEINSLFEKTQELNNLAKSDSFDLINKEESLKENLNELLEKIDYIYNYIIANKKIYFLDGMHGGILFKDFFDEVKDSNRIWEEHLGFPVGFEQFDWPNFSIISIIKNLNISRKAHIPISIQVGIGTFESLYQHYPEFIKQLKEYFDKDIVELVDGTYSQPFNLIQGDETEIREFLNGILTSLYLFNRRPYVYARQEFGFHPQLPQILRNLGYYGVSTRTKSNGWVKGIPYSFIRWIGPDGSEIPCIPTHEKIHTGELRGGDIFKKFDYLLYEFFENKHDYDKVIFSNLADLTDPMEGRKEFYLFNALTGYPTELYTYTSLLKKILGEELNLFEKSSYKIREKYDFAEIEPFTGDKHDIINVKKTIIPKYRYLRDEFGVKWYQMLGGLANKGAEIYSRMKITEKNLLDAEKIDAICDLLNLDNSDSEILEKLWKTYLQALNHDSISNFEHKTGDYMRARRNILPKWEGPSKGIKCGEKAVLNLDFVYSKTEQLILNKMTKLGKLYEPFIKELIKTGIDNEENELIGYIPIIMCTFSSTIFHSAEKEPELFNKASIYEFQIKIPLETLEKRLRHISINTIHKFISNLKYGINIINLLDPRKPNKETPIFIEKVDFDENNNLLLDLIIQHDSGLFKLNFYILKFIIIEKFFNFPVSIDEYMIYPPKLSGISIKSLDPNQQQFILENQFISVHFGFEKKIGFNIKQINLKMEPDKEVQVLKGKNFRIFKGLHKSSVRFQRLRDFGFRLIIESKGNSASITLYNEVPTLFFKTYLKRHMKIAQFYPALNDIKTYVDYPFGFEETHRKSITALNQSSIIGMESNGSIIRIHLMNTGNQYLFFSDKDESEERLFQMMNVADLRPEGSELGNLEMFATPLFKGRTTKFALTIIAGTQKFPEKENTLKSNYWINSHAIVIDNDGKEYNANPNEIKFEKEFHLVKNLGSESIFLSSFRKVPKSDDFEIRFFNFSSNFASLILETSYFSIENLKSCNFLGEPKNYNEDNLNFSPWEIKTFRIQK